MKKAARCSCLGGLLLGAIALTAPLPARTGTPSLFSPDSGEFRILVSGQQAGKEEFDIGPNGGDWLAHGSAEVQTPTGVTRVRGTLDLHSDGTPARYEWSSQGAKKASAVVSFSGSTATIVLHVEGMRPYTQQFTFPSPRVAILDNNLYDQYGILARLYDWDRKGVQTFAVLVPQELTPGSVTVELVGSQEVNGKKLDELQVKTADLEVDLYLDGRRLVRIVSPSANAEILRE